MYLAGGTNYKAVIGARPNGEQQNFKKKLKPTNRLEGFW